MFRACLRSRARKDEKRVHPMSHERMQLLKECNKILDVLDRTMRTDTVEIALSLGWEADPVILGSLYIAAQEWLDRQHLDFTNRHDPLIELD